MACDSFIHVYHKARDVIRVSEVKRTRAQVASIIKNNNNEVLTLMNVEEEFKKMIMEKLQLFLGHQH